MEAIPRRDHVVAERDEFRVIKRREVLRAQYWDDEDCDWKDCVSALQSQPFLRMVEDATLPAKCRTRPDYEIVAEIAGRMSDGHIPERDRQEAITHGCDWYWVKRARSLLAEARRQCAGEAQTEGGDQ